MIGDTILHYRIIEKLGEGGMGVVYKAEDISLKRIVALKFLPRGLSSDIESRSRFVQEAQAASALQDNNICTIHDISKTDDEEMFIVMDCYGGESLKERISRGPLKNDDALEVAVQVAKGLSKAHEKGIIHRDIKPGNIFITNDGVVKILDFGLAKASGRTQLTQVGSTVGTCNYMSPEQARGDEVDGRTDIWSLGIVLYEMLTGVPPFKSDYDQDVTYSIENREPDLARIPAELLPILQKALAKSPADRYQKIEEMLSDIDRARNRVVGGKGFYPSGHRVRRMKLRTKLSFTASLVALLAFAAVYYFRVVVKLDTPNAAATNSMKMIVVLPFENLGSPDDDYFAEGMRDEISNRLSALGSMGVISRGSAEKCAHTKKTAREIGRELGVDYILEGTIQWARGKSKESRVRIFPQPVRVSDDINIWSDSYDRVINDVFQVQGEIAQNVVSKLGIKLVPGEQVAGPPPTNNLDAYDYYLKALKFHYGPSTGSNIKTAVKLYQQAIALDSNFAAAHAQLSIAYNGLFFWWWDRDSLNLKKAARHLSKAERIDPNIAEVHLAKFYYYARFTSDTEKIFQELKNTLEIQPNNAEANIEIAYYYRDRGQVELARKSESKAVQLDPLNARYPSMLGGQCNSRREYKDAEQYFKRAIELSPATSGYYVALAQNYVDLNGSTRLAWEAVKNIKDDEYEEDNSNIFVYLSVLDRDFDKAMSILKSSRREYRNVAQAYMSSLQMIALIYRYQGNYGLARKYFDSSKVKIEKLIATSPKDFRLPLSLSISYAGIGEKERALGQLEKGIKLLDWYEDKAWIDHNRKIYLAQISILVGDHETALKQIEALVSTKVAFFSVNRMKLDPLYDPLRNLPEYKKIIKENSG